MNDRKRAWQILHSEIARRVRGVPDNVTWHRQLAAILRDADDDATLIVELAGFGATFAEMSAHKSQLINAAGGNVGGADIMEIADGIGRTVMDEPED
ncbi:hypothetical protein AWB91_09095 [Mycobacterium paraense]|uniref:Uncharacterized protein n=1 Tax=Mycobacterium paraense TaxID=767916 RepID=A0ABX3VS32_9MYCO|nr:hypothetical protein [Mycobacterium paraense]ORW33272.1 hypothetical protein AWB91_09095 [Mycobacterium paraense]ORW34667.1 hypothetical protein AWB88_02680 [Mycobacterium paraense]